MIGLMLFCLGFGCVAFVIGGRTSVALQSFSSVPRTFLYFDLLGLDGHYAFMFHSKPLDLEEVRSLVKGGVTMPSADGWESDWAMTVSSLGLTEGEVAELVPTFFRKPPVFQCGDRVLYAMVDPDSGAVTFHSVIVERHTFV